MPSPGFAYDRLALFQNSSTASLSEVYGVRGATPPVLSAHPCESLPPIGTVPRTTGNQVGIHSVTRKTAK